MVNLERDGGRALLSLAGVITVVAPIAGGCWTVACAAAVAPDRRLR